MKKLILLLSGITIMTVQARAQKLWSLQECIVYAQTHNIQIKQSEIQTRLTELTLKQSRLSRIPNISAGMNAGYNFGRSISPATNQYVNKQLFYFQPGLNMNMNLFSWFQTDNTIKANQFATAASRQLFEKAKNDVSLNVATAYLQILLNTEQLRVSEQQVQLSLSQLENTKRQVEAGSLPESNQADLESQVATDSSNLVAANNARTLSVLQMKALLNMDFETPFAVDTISNVDAIPLMSLAANPPADIYASAVGLQPQILADSLSLLAQQKNLAATKGALYPSLYLSGSLGTNYANNYQEYRIDSSSVPALPIGSVKINQTDYIVNSLPYKEPVQVPYKSPFKRQISNNFNQSIGIGLNIPIFNGWSASANMRRAKLNVLNQQLTVEQDKLTLKQNIYQAFADAKGSLEQYNAAVKATAAAQLSFDYATQRYNLGLINAVDYLTTQNNLFKARTNMLTAKYNYIFKVKVLEFYKTLNVKFN